jgi:Cdc6-like AAA superfamily ATPase
MAHKIVKAPELFEEAYVPLIVPYWEQHISELENCVRPALFQEKPMHAWLFGQPGSGKTPAAKFVLRKLSRDGRVASIYINCLEHNSYHAVLDKLVRELRILGAEKLNTPFKLERFRHFVGTRPFIIILAEIDQPKGRKGTR